MEEQHVRIRIEDKVSFLFLFFFFFSLKDRMDEFCKIAARAPFAAIHAMKREISSFGYIVISRNFEVPKALRLISYFPAALVSNFLSCGDK